MKKKSSYSKARRFNTDHHYIKRVVIPFFMGFVEKELLSVVYDLNGAIIIATNKFAQFLGHSNWHEIKSRTLAEIIQDGKHFLGQHFDSHCSETKSRTLAEIAHTSKRLLGQQNKIRKKIIRTESATTHLNILPFNGSTISAIVFHIPIFNPDGVVIATRAIWHKVNLMSLILSLNSDIINFDSTKNKFDSSLVNLTPRQNEIVFLLAIGFSQNYVASYLKISRGTVSKLLNDSICPAFGIDGINTQLLVKKVIVSGYLNKVNHLFLKAQFIEISEGSELPFLYNSLKR